MFNIDIIVNDDNLNHHGLCDDLDAIKAVCIDYDINLVDYLQALLYEAIRHEGDKIINVDDDAIASRIKELQPQKGSRGRSPSHLRERSERRLCNAKS